MRDGDLGVQENERLVKTDMMEKPNLDETATFPTVQPHVYPLDEFYARAGLVLPRIEVIPGEEVPEPFRTLLVHKNDMTPTLEGFHGADIHLEILRSEPRDDFYYREVVLRLNGTNRPVEFGANKISLNLFPPTVRQLIRQEYLPLGRLLKEYTVPHNTQAKAFLRLEADEFIQRAFGLKQAHTLYGRRATIADPQQRPLSEIVEILPPA